MRRIDILRVRVTCRTRNRRTRLGRQKVLGLAKVEICSLRRLIRAGNRGGSCTKKSGYDSHSGKEPLLTAFVHLVMLFLINIPYFSLRH
jgi:hypothetical protein